MSTRRRRTETASSDDNQNRTLTDSEGTDANMQIPDRTSPGRSSERNTPSVQTEMSKLKNIEMFKKEMDEVTLFNLCVGTEKTVPSPV